MVMTQEEIARLPVTRTIHAYDGRSKRFAGYPCDWAVDEIAYGCPAQHASRGRIYRACGGGTLVEVGAHIGTTTLVAADFFNWVCAFEPASRNFALLEHNIKLNDAKNIKAVQMAVSEHPGEADFYLCGDDRAVCHSLSSGVTRTSQSEKVQVTTLDKHLGHVRDCGLLLVDAEGHDMKVLRGGRTFIDRNRPVIVIEFAPQFWNLCESYVHQLTEFTIEHGYRMFADFGNNFSPVSHALVNEMFGLWKNTCQAWLDIYLVPPGQHCDIFPNR
jgi:FkbM family methyltransferase